MGSPSPPHGIALDELAAAPARARTWALIGVVTGALVVLFMQLAASVLDRPIELLSREPQIALKGVWYAGAMSNVGSLAWFVGATACLLAWLVERSLGRNATPLLLAGLLLTILGADDLFVLHDGLYRKFVGERWTYALYLVLFAAYVFAYRRFLRRYDGLRILGVAFAFFLTSLLLDRLENQRHLLEDGAKLLGIATIVSLFTAISFSHLRGAAAAEH
jgi:hypothetical protein